MADNTDGGMLGGGDAVQNAVQNSAPGGVQNGVQNAAPGSADWGFLPQGLHDMADGYDKPESFWADMSRLKGLDREHKALHGKSPDSFVSENDWNAFWKAAGRPDTADGYTLPDTWTAKGAPENLIQSVNEALGADKGALANISHELGLTGRQAEKLHQVYGGLLANAMQQEAVNQTSPEQVIGSLWPQETKKHLDSARRGARHAGLGNELDKAGLSANPLVLKLAHALGEALGEGGLPGTGAAPAALPQGEEARQEMYRIIASEAYRNNDPATMKKLEALAARVGMS